MGKTWGYIQGPAVQSPICANPTSTLYVRPGNISRDRLLKARFVNSICKTWEYIQGPAVQSPICANPRLTL